MIRKYSAPWSEIQTVSLLGGFFQRAFALKTRVARQSRALASRLKPLADSHGYLTDFHRYRFADGRRDTATFEKITNQKHSVLAVSSG